MTAFDGIVLLAMFGGLYLLLLGHSWEFARWRTVKAERSPSLHRWILGLMLLMGVYGGLRISPFLPLFIWPLAVLLYLWQTHVLKRIAP